MKKRRRARFELALANRARCAGFTFIETIMMVALVAIVSALVVPRAFDTSDATALAQADALASDLQRAQWLATVSAQSVHLCTYTNAYAVQQGDAAPGQACPTSLPSAPTTNQPVVVALSNDITLSAPGTTLSFDSIGQPSAAANYVLGATSSTLQYQVSVTASSGVVAVSAL